MTPSFLLDTNVLSNLRRRRWHPSLAAWLEAAPPASLWISVVTIAEIQDGICRVNDSAVAASVQLWLDGLLREERFRIVELGTNAALVLGRMWAARPLRDLFRSDPRSPEISNGADLAIAATAIAQEMVMVTGNIADFQRIHALFPLPGLYDPFQAFWFVEQGILPN